MKCECCKTGIDRVLPFTLTLSDGAQVLQMCAPCRVTTVLSMQRPAGNA